MMYEYWLAVLPGISDRRKKDLRDHVGSARKIFFSEKEAAQQLGEKERKALEEGRKMSPEKIYQEFEKAGIRFVPWFSEQYPSRLKRISAPPYAIYVKGALPEEERLSVAIVGARMCTPYGEQMALEYGETLAAAGIQIISGMARGIDGAGQRGALNAGGTTYAVLGCGADICYPRENFGLYTDIQKKGGILSELPPKTEPRPYFFPARNRLISALADLVLIIEAKEKSGSLITADFALEQGKDVYALPGPVTSPQSQGCHRLIAQGAGILLNPQELLSEMGVSHIKIRQIANKPKKMLESTENILYSCLGFTPKGVGQLSEETGFSSRKVLEELVTLELQGEVKEISKNYYVRIR